jgi:hypothetical protein
MIRFLLLVILAFLHTVGPTRARENGPRQVTTRDRLLGEWAVTKSQETIRFANDGTVTVSYEEDVDKDLGITIVITLKGTYSVEK